MNRPPAASVPAAVLDLLHLCSGLLDLGGLLYDLCEIVHRRTRPRG